MIVEQDDRCRGGEGQPRQTLIGRGRSLGRGPPGTCPQPERSRPEGVDEGRDIPRVDVVANLLALVAEDLVLPAFDIALPVTRQMRGFSGAPS